MTPGVTLRAYQVEAIDAVRGAVARGSRRPLVAMATGSGKAVIAAAIMETAVAKGSDVLFLVHRDELLRQAEEKLLRVAPDLDWAVGWVKAERDEWAKPVTLASIQTLSRPQRLKRLQDAGRRYSLIIIDESHHAMADTYVRTLEALGAFEPRGPVVIGFTATPQRADAKDLGDVFTGIAYHRDMLAMMLGADAALCELRGMRVRLAQFDPQKLHTRAGEFIAAESEQALLDADAPHHIVEAWKRNAPDRQTIVFTPTIHAAHEVAAAFRAAGIPAAGVSGETQHDERRRLLDEFSARRIRVLANAQLLTEGYDEPDVGCIVIARPTKSKPFYIQMIGRGTRLKSSAVPYDDCVVLDVVGATDRLDLTVLPQLFGLGTDDDLSPDDEQLVLQALADGGVRAALDALEETQGRIVVRRVELFQRRDLNWARASDTLFVLGLVGETVTAELRDAGWELMALKKGDAPRLIGCYDTQDAVIAAGERYARRSGAAALIDRKAAWRQRAASEKQRDALRRFRLPQWRDPDLAMGDAGDLLDVAIAKARLARR